jgi:hypothetical protein
MMAKPAGSLFKALIERAIIGCDDPAERRERVEIARDTGIFTDEEAAAWRKLLGLEAAA